MYFFYIDESGTRDPKTGSTDDSAGKTVFREPLYVLTAVSLYERKWRTFEGNISACKLQLCRRVHKDVGLDLKPIDCEVKSTWLRIPSARVQSRFLTALTDEERNNMADCYYNQLAPCYMKVFSVVIDKRMLRGNHITCDWLHHKAYELLLERINNYLRECQPKHQGVIVMDDTDKSINRSLSMKSASLQKHGNGQVDFKAVVEHPFFTDSKLSNGVQLADLCGYNVYRAFKDKDFDYDFFQKVLPFIYSSARTSENKLDGLKIWPDDSELVGYAKNCYEKYKKNPS